MSKQIEIIFCPVWNYKPRAASLAAQIKRATGLDASLQSGQSGQFDVIADGKLIFSRFDNGLFPEEEDIVKILTEKWETLSL